MSLDKKCLKKEWLGLGLKYILLNSLLLLETHLTNGLKLQGMHHQYAQKFAYGHGPFGANCHEVRIQLF